MLFSIALEVLVPAIRQEEEIKSTHTGKEEIKLSLFTNNVILYIENPIGSATKLLDLINLVKLEDKINTGTSMAFLYTNNELSERETKKIIPFIIATTTTKKIRYLGINLTREVRDMYSEN